MKLEIGGGSIPRDGYVNFDPVHGAPGFRGYLGANPLPMGDNTVDRVYASHVMEHIPIVGGDRIRAMNDVWRVLKPGGEFEIILPVIMYTDHAGLVHEPPRETGTGAPVYAGWQGWSDPSHSSAWVHPESFWYFTGGPAGTFRANADYGILYWDEVSMSIRDGWESHVVLRKPVETL